MFVTAAILLLLSYSILPTVLLRIIFKRRRGKGLQKQALFLTFDDGPSQEYTNQLLDILKRHQVKGTFFVVTEFALQNREMITRMAQEGHSIGIHSREHKSALFRGPFFLRRDFRGSLSTMAELGQTPVYYRPPWGQLNLFSFFYMKRYGLKLVLWDVMAEDWSKSATPMKIKEKLLKRVRPGSVICLHDGRGAEGAPGKTLEAVDQVIPLLREKGYDFYRLEAGYGTDVI